MPGIVYTVSLQDLNVQSQLNTLEQGANRLEGSIAGINIALRTLGVGFGLYEIKDWAESWISGAADYEQAMLKIKNASKDASTGINNQFYLNDIVDKYKLKLDDAADAYGSFLFKIKNANLTGGVKNKIFEELTAIAKVGGLSQSQMNATIYELGTLLGVGSLEARQMRMLGNVHPNLMKYIADVIGLKDYEKTKFIHGSTDKDEAKGMTELQQLYKAMSGGKLTKAALSSLDILPKALDQYYADIKSKIPETLELLSSETNTLQTAIQRLRNEVLTFKPEIVSFIETLKDWLHWIKENKDHIVHIAEGVAIFVKYLLEYKAAMFLINGAQAIYAEWMVGYLGKETTAIDLIGLKTAAIYAQITATNALTAAIERQMALQAGGSGLVGYGGMAAAEGAVIGNAASKTTVASGAAFFGAVQKVFIVGMVADLLMGFLPKGEKTGQSIGWKEYFQDWGGFKGLLNSAFPGIANKSHATSIEEENEKFDSDRHSRLFKQGVNYFEDLLSFKNLKGNLPQFPESGKKENTNGQRIVPETDKVTGQHVITYNILHGGKIIGIERQENNVNSLNDIDEKQFAIRMAETIDAVLNDSQIH